MGTFRGRRTRNHSLGLTPYYTARLTSAYKLLGSGLAGIIGLCFTFICVIVSSEFRHSISRGFVHPPIAQAIRYKLFKIDPIPKNAIVFGESFSFEGDEGKKQRSFEFSYNVSDNNTETYDTEEEANETKTENIPINETDDISDSSANDDDESQNDSQNIKDKEEDPHRNIVTSTSVNTKAADDFFRQDQVVHHPIVESLGN
ncbi:hypothetical protein TVAG_071300 [Trichomonas vaginalis G3]|uniref:Uncharacterized protein n=1 Tax=Trichomonas vaginalis (strain ATCC PRA-98 / G3) TaxID=412133 RepID=A2D833_TRIV3|nr:hypothetical protein TVAGG3_1046130 [Trichomonas vaginalis G3]EAY23466.1 hypothetical protein TVAG_071300 [Trichomonas vaginalis G3]KAI5493883.1 hypothetical protein TVAGG3_1046130 [Trichomonas vaginalis G3]|eukprot:XP_001584452.1 hypothetical protein [Trichomonas vaginalis G3]